jgi:hypothetical protein
VERVSVFQFLHSNLNKRRPESLPVLLWVEKTTQHITAKPGVSPQLLGFKPDGIWYPLRDLQVQSVRFRGPPDDDGESTCSFGLKVSNPNTTFTVPDSTKPHGAQIGPYNYPTGTCELSWPCSAAPSSAAGVERGVRCSYGWSAVVRYWLGGAGLDRFSVSVVTNQNIGLGMMRLNWVVNGSVRDAAERKHRTCREGSCEWGDFGETVRDISYGAYPHYIR